MHDSVYDFVYDSSSCFARLYSGLRQLKMCRTRVRNGLGGSRDGGVSVSGEGAGACMGWVLGLGLPGVSVALLYRVATRH